LFHNSNVFGYCIIHILYTECAKIKKKNSSGAKRLTETGKRNIKKIYFINELGDYSTNIGTKYFKRGIYSPFFTLQNAVCFIILTFLVTVLFTFYIQSVLKLKKIVQAPKV